MFRYKRIKEYFCTDSLNQSCKLFVTDCGYVCVIPMKKDSDFLSSLKVFVKRIGAPEAFICDAAKAQTPTTVRKSLTNIRTSL